MKNVITIIVLLLLYSCTGTDYREISGNSTFVAGGGLLYISSNHAILHRTTIYPDVVDYSYNDDYIIAKQVPDKKDYISFLGEDLYSIYGAYANYIKDTAAYIKQNGIEFKGKIEGDSTIYNIFKERGVTRDNSIQDIQQSESIAKYLIEHDPYHQKVFANDTNYWIIYNPQDTLFGPMTKEEYLIKRKELNVPDNLQLEE